MRYRYDEERQHRFNTVELIVDERLWRPERAVSKGAMLVRVRVGVQEVSLQRQGKLAGGRWNPARRVWELRRDQALKRGLKDRIEHAKVSIRRNHELSICRNFQVSAYRNKFLLIEASFYS